MEKNTWGKPPTVKTPFFALIEWRWSLYRCVDVQQIIAILTCIRQDKAGLNAISIGSWHSKRSRPDEDVLPVWVGGVCEVKDCWARLNHDIVTPVWHRQGRVHPIPRRPGNHALLGAGDVPHPLTTAFGGPLQLGQQVLEERGDETNDKAWENWNKIYKFHLWKTSKKSTEISLFTVTSRQIVGAN